MRFWSRRAAWELISERKRVREMKFLEVKYFGFFFLPGLPGPTASVSES